MLKITNHSPKGKLAGLHSLNTSVLENKYCSKMRVTESVCKSCYAANMEKRYKSLAANDISNMDMLSSGFLTTRELPIIIDRVFRFHSLGELVNSTHLHNLLNIAEHNPDTTFTLWTKRSTIVSSVLDTRPKPSNVILVFSISKVDSKIQRLPKHFDKTFSVYTKAAVVANPRIGINCHSKCIDCMKCYTKSDTTTAIKELIK